MFDEHRKRHEIARERLRFEATTMTVIAVKAAPWSDGPRRFGSARISPDIQVVTTSGQKIVYPDIDAMLEEWIGD